jgi:hypothetical protein
MQSICEQEDINVPSIELAESVNDLNTNIKLNPKSKKRKKSEGEITRITNIESNLIK